MDYISKIANYVSGVILGTTLLFGSGCTPLPKKVDTVQTELDKKIADYEASVAQEESAYQGKGLFEKVKHLEEIRKQLHEDGVLNPARDKYSRDEVLEIFKQKGRIEALKDSAKESKEMTDRLNVLGTAYEGDLAALAKSDQVSEYLIVVYKNDSVRVLGVTEGDHWKLKGTLEDHVNALGLNRDEAYKNSPSQAGDQWGYKHGADLSQKIEELKRRTLPVPRAKWGEVAKYISTHKFQDGTLVDVDVYNAMLADKKVIDVRYLPLIGTKEGKAPEKKEGGKVDKPDDKAAAEKKAAEEKAAAEKKAAEEKAAAEKKAAEEKAAAEKKKKKPGVDTFDD
jgi:hypothetical protein